MDKIREELKYITDVLPKLAESYVITIWENGCARLQIRDTDTEYIICRVKSHDWQKELAKDLEEQKK